MTKILYVSIDIEADGPAPGLNSMLALGAAAFTPAGEMIGTWYSTLLPLESAVQDPGTMKWWETQPEAWAEVTRNRKHASFVIPRFTSWVRELPGKPVAVAKPAAYDFAWVNYYSWLCTAGNPLGFSCKDMGSFADGAGISEKEKREIYVSIDKTGLRPHVAVDDAIEQGRYWLALLKAAKASGGAR